MSTILWPDKFPEIPMMFDLLQKMSKASWRNDNVFNSDNITKWLNNFTGEKYQIEIEQRIALWMLCNFTYYNEEEVNHLWHIVYKSFVHDIALRYGSGSEAELSLLLSQTYFAAMGEASESGGLMLYYFRQQAGLPINRFFYPSAIPKNENGIVVFVDDLTLSGRSASSFFDENMKEMKFQTAFYLTLFASEEAKQRIQQHNINVIASTVLGERDRCFSDQSILFHNFPELKEYAFEIAKAYGEKLSPNHPLGHKNGQYCFGLHYNIPNNTLPIFWSNRANWTPIFPRKEKRRNNGGNYTFEKFI